MITALDNIPTQNNEKNIELQSNISVVKQENEQLKQSRIRRHKEYELDFPQGILKLSFKDDNTFVFNSKSNKVIGSFTIDNIINYLLKKDVDHVIKKLINLILCKESGILNYKSPFINDVEILMILNRWFKRFDATIKDMNDTDRKLIRKFICHILEHSMDVIAHVSKRLSTANEDSEVKKKLMRYGSEILFRLTSIVQIETHECLEQCTQIQSSYDKILLIENKINSNLREILHTPISEKEKEENKVDTMEYFNQKMKEKNEININ